MKEALANAERYLRKALPWIIGGILLWIVVSRLHQSKLLTSGDPAPAFTAALADGDRIDLAAQRGKVVVLNFWATWCPPCRAEAPVLARVHRDLERDNGMVLGVLTEPFQPHEARRAADQLGMTFPIALGTQEHMQAFRVSLLPTTYVISTSGEIVDSFTGAVEEEELREAIERAR